MLSRAYLTPCRSPSVMRTTSRERRFRKSAGTRTDTPAAPPSHPGIWKRGRRRDELRLCGFVYILQCVCVIVPRVLIVVLILLLVTVSVCLFIYHYVSVYLYQFIYMHLSTYLSTYFIYVPTTLTPILCTYVY